MISKIIYALLAFQVHRLTVMAAFIIAPRSQAVPLADTVTDSQINSVTFHREGFPLSNPFIYLGSEDRLELMFDDLSPLQRDFSWELIYCNRQWMQENIPQTEYMDGFPDTRIHDMKFSAGTTVLYRNFRLLFPVENMQILQSGNYVLRIYQTDNPQLTVLMKRFFVAENIAVPDVKYLPANEQVTRGQGFEISWERPGHKSYTLENFHLYVMQNLRWQFIRKLPEPSPAGENLIKCCYPGECIFDGGHEYLNFDIKSRRYQSPRIRRMVYLAPYYHIYLYDDKLDPFRPYYFTEDINGNFVVENNETSEDRSEADYVVVHFSLSVGQPFADEEIYLYGALTNRNLADKYRMQYNFSTKSYEISLLLKQGYYNYEYITKQYDGKLSYAMQGSHSETGNEYLFLLYYTDEARNYDHLIGLKVYNTLQR